MTVWINRIDSTGDGPTLAVKGVIDVAGVPTTAGSRAWADRHPGPAAVDAPVVAAARSAGYRVVGTTTLHELANGVTGVNPWFGTPPNPRDATLVPGGSSSGSAVAVATGAADLGLATDTGGSARIPAACCGVVGLKTTTGRFSREGIVPLAPSLDAVGLIGRDVAAVLRGLVALGPAADRVDGTDQDLGDGPGTLRIGRYRPQAEPAFEDAVDRVLAETGWTVEDVELPGLAVAADATFTLLVAESAQLYAWMLDHPETVGEDIVARLRAGIEVGPSGLATAHAVAGGWRDELAAAFRTVDLIALPTIPAPPPTLEDADKVLLAELTRAANLAGLPALSVPLPGPVGAALQLYGPPGADERLLAAGRRVELVRESGPDVS